MRKGNFGAVESPGIRPCNVDSGFPCWMRAHFRGHALPEKSKSGGLDLAPGGGVRVGYIPPPFGAIFCPSRAAQRCTRAAIFQGIPRCFLGGSSLGSGPGSPLCFTTCGQVDTENIRSNLSYLGKRGQFTVGGGMEGMERDGGGESSKFAARAAAATTAPSGFRGFFGRLRVLGGARRPGRGPHPGFSRDVVPNP
mgnify:CR=1 FL=1